MAEAASGQADASAEVQTDRNKDEEDLEDLVLEAMTKINQSDWLQKQPRQKAPQPEGGTLVGPDGKPLNIQQVAELLAESLTSGESGDLKVEVGVKSNTDKQDAGS